MPEKKAICIRDNFFQRIGSNLRQTLSETVCWLCKVSWPTRREALYLTGVVLVVIFGFGFVLWLLDLAYLEFFKLILG